MKAWPDTNGSAIARYLRQLRLRSLVNPRPIIVSVLRGFQESWCSVMRSSSRVSRDALEAWLHERAAAVAAFNAFSTVPASSIDSSTSLCMKG